MKGVEIPLCRGKPSNFSTRGFRMFVTYYVNRMYTRNVFFGRLTCYGHDCTCIM